MSVTSSPPRARGDREFIVTQMSRLNETLLVSFGAMSADIFPAVDRVSKSYANSIAITGSQTARADPQRVASSWKVSIPEPNGPLPPPARRLISRRGRLLLRTCVRKTICATRWRSSSPIRPPSPIVFHKGERETGTRHNPLESLDNSGAGTPPPAPSPSRPAEG